jgi:AcrR family transcriptional regulator
MQDISPPEVSGTAGRPRDPTIDARILDAAIRIYADGGWSAFTFEAIARLCGVGKGAIYRRWNDRSALLAAAIEARWEPLNCIDTGSLRNDLKEFVELVVTRFADNQAGVAINLALDARRFADVRALAAPFRANVVERVRTLLGRAVERGEISGRPRLGIVIDVILGAVTNHILLAPDEGRGDRTEFVLRLVDLLVGGIAADRR